MFCVEKGICGKAGEWAVGARKMETCKTEHDYRTAKKYEAELQYRWIQ